MPESNKNEIDMTSFYPTPYVNTGLSDEVLQALQSKFELSSDIEFLILDNDESQNIKAMYHVWVNFLPQQDGYENGLALVAVGLIPEVVVYYSETELMKIFESTKPVTSIPETILAKVKPLVRP